MYIFKRIYTELNVLRAGHYFSVAEHLFLCEVLNSVPSTTKKKKKLHYCMCLIRLLQRVSVAAQCLVHSKYLWNEEINKWNASV